MPVAWLIATALLSLTDAFVAGLGDAILFLLASRLFSHILYIYKHTLCYKIKSLILLKQIKFTKQTRARTRQQDIMADMDIVGVYCCHDIFFISA